jgi:hypothetical protein
VHENNDLFGSDHCPDCNMAFAIAAVDLSLIWGGTVFVCPVCDLTSAETTKPVLN